MIRGSSLTFKFPTTVSTLSNAVNHHKSGILGQYGRVVLQFFVFVILHMFTYRITCFILVLHEESPVLWTGKKPDLDWTGLEKTGLPVAVATYFFYKPVAVAGIDNLFRTGLDQLTGPNQTFSYTY